MVYTAANKTTMLSATCVQHTNHILCESLLCKCKSTSRINFTIVLTLLARHIINIYKCLSFVKVLLQFLVSMLLCGGEGGLNVIEFGTQTNPFHKPYFGFVYNTGTFHLKLDGVFCNSYFNATIYTFDQYSFLCYRLSGYYGYLHWKLCM